MSCWRAPGASKTSLISSVVMTCFLLPITRIVYIINVSCYMALYWIALYFITLYCCILLYRILYVYSNIFYVCCDTGEALGW